MEILQSASIYNLDAIPEDAIVTATIDSGRLILNKAQLFARLGRRRTKRTPVVTPKGKTPKG